MKNGRKEKHTGGEWSAAIWGKDLKGNSADARHTINTLVDGVLVSVCDVPITSDNGMMRPDGKGGSEEYASYKIGKAESVKNATLIAAAPELLAACQHLLAFFKSEHPEAFKAGGGSFSTDDRAPFELDLAAAKAAVRKATK